MVKTLKPIGNSLGLVIEKAVLDLLKIDRDTPLEVSTDGVGIIIKPLRQGHAGRVDAAAAAMIDQHRETFRKLAE